MRTVTVIVGLESERELRVTWFDGVPWPPYVILRSTIETLTFDIRRCLKEIVEAALRKDYKAYPSLERKLARRGHLLYQALFLKAGGEGDPARIRQHYELMSEPWSLRFIVDVSVFVPWGLVYPENVDTDVDPLKFWCIGRELSTLYKRILPDAAGSGHNISPLKVLHVVHEDVYKEVRAAEPVLEHERQFLDWRQKNHGDPLSTVEGLKKRWRESKHEIGLLEFYCHASASSLALSDTELIQAAILPIMLAGRKHSPSGIPDCLVVVNGCSTSVGGKSADFVSAISQEGFCGFVGTETEVPDIFALRFAIRLLDLLFNNQLTLGEAMCRLYQRHFPLSLVYGLYALPGFRISQREACDLLSSDTVGNLSYTEVGTGRNLE